MSVPVNYQDGSVLKTPFAKQEAKKVQGVVCVFDGALRISVFVNSQDG